MLLCLRAPIWIYCPWADFQTSGMLQVYTLQRKTSFSTENNACSFICRTVCSKTDLFFPESRDSCGLSAGCFLFNWPKSRPEYSQLSKVLPKYTFLLKAIYHQEHFWLSCFRKRSWSGHCSLVSVYFSTGLEPRNRVSGS